MFNNAAGLVCRMTPNMAASVPFFFPLCGGVPGQGVKGRLEGRRTSHMETHNIDTLPYEPWGGVFKTAPGLSLNKANPNNEERDVLLA